MCGAFFVLYSRASSVGEGIPTSVIPAQAGTQRLLFVPTETSRSTSGASPWVPAFAGMTGWRGIPRRTRLSALRSARKTLLTTEIILCMGFHRLRSARKTSCIAEKTLYSAGKTLNRSAKTLSAANRTLRSAGKPLGAAGKTSSLAAAHAKQAARGRPVGKSRKPGKFTRQPGPVCVGRGPSARQSPCAVRPGRGSSRRA